MATWVKNTTNGQTTRKKWNIEDQSSLRNLKLNLAENGCSDVQYTLAKQLLEENTENDPLENQIQGVNWLVKATQQGHEQAYMLLSECYNLGRGINECNEMNVREVLEMSPGEREARRAARELFAYLSNGEEFVTASQLEKRMREIYKMDRKRRRSTNEEIEGSPSHFQANRLNRSSSLNPANHISEANFLSAAVNYSNGQLPSVNNAMILSVPDPQSLDHVPCFHRPFFHPILFFSLLYHRFVNLMSTFPGASSSNLQVLVLLIAYSFFTSDNLVTFVPIGCYYLSLAVMLITTFKMLKSKHDFIDFRIWSALFNSIEGFNVNTENPENRYLRNNLKPYLYFFVAFFINILIHPMISENWLLGSEVTVISFVLTFITMLAFMYTSMDPFPDMMILVSFGLNVLAKYPYEKDSVVTTEWRFLDLKVPAFSTFVIGNGIEFCLSCRTLLYLLIPGGLIFIAHRNNWRGTYKYFLPHCVTLSWLQICIINSQTATMFGLVRAALGLSGLMLFLPLFGIVTLLIPVFAAIEWLSIMDSTVRIWSSVTAAFIAIIISGYMAASRRTERYITFLQIAICIIATVFLTFPYMRSEFDADYLQREKVTVVDEHPQLLHMLDWDTYYRYCHQPAWERMSKIKTQLRCSHLDGTLVRWEGLILDVEIGSKRNFRANLLTSYLPKIIADYIMCYYGDRNEVQCDSNENCEEMRRFIIDNNSKECNLDKWNTYEYEIKVRMSSGILSKPAEVTIKAQHAFGNFTQGLNNSDRIWFVGILRNFMSSSSFDDGEIRMNVNYDANNMRLGRKNPLIELQSIGCIHCHNTHLNSFHVNDGMKINARMKDLLRGVKYLLNVLLNPLVNFK